MDCLKIRRYSDALYFGQVHPKTTHREGKGIMKYKNSGRVYEGEFYLDLRHGNGFEQYPNGNTYLGGFAKGKAHGNGIYKWANGEIYDGEWQNGLKNGNGMWKGNNGDSYIGEWKDSRADGYGVHVWSNGDRYEGEWKGCLKHGHGTDIFANGDVYVGQYVNGKPDGNGQYTWSNASFYVGQFKTGLKHGKGKWRRNKDNTSNQYEGEYANDKKDGYGEFMWASGNIYKGGYKGDEREGYGKMQWTDGSTYEGDWARGIQHGRGKMTFPDGTIKEGYFENNVYKGDSPPIMNQSIKKKKGPLKSLSNSHSNKGLNRSDSKLSTNSRKRKGSTSRLIITDKKRTPRANALRKRENSNSSREFSRQNQLNTSNPNTGYINDNNIQHAHPAPVIHKPSKNAKRSMSDSNSSFGEGASPYKNPEREYMLSCINNGGKNDNDFEMKNENTKSDDALKTFNSAAGSKPLKSKKAGKLEPIIKAKNRGKGSVQSRSHYGKFPNKTNIAKPPSKRAGSGSRKTKKLSPIRKPGIKINKR